MGTSVGPVDFSAGGHVPSAATPSRSAVGSTPHPSPRCTVSAWLTISLCPLSEPRKDILRILTRYAHSAVAAR
jgi:hypothetical protein